MLWEHVDWVQFPAARQKFLWPFWPWKIFVWLLGAEKPELAWGFRPFNSQQPDKIYN
jgi:hypothetical protein